MKKKYEISDVMYITRQDRKSIVHLANGETVQTFNPIKKLIAEFPEEAFEVINKGIVVFKKYVSSVDGNIYLMSDGVSFTGRVRENKKQKENIEKYISNKISDEWNQYSILDKMPIPFCIIELVFDENGHGMDFIFRYCNKEMEELAGRTIDEMIDKSFYEVFTNGDKKWLVIYADVAINGTTKVIEEFSPEIDSKLRIYCYQPKQNFCACALIKI